MTRYVIIGAGALGATLAAQLHESSVPYVLVARERQVGLVRQQGLTYVRPSGEVTLPIEITTADDLGDLQPDDVLVFTPKTQDLDGTLATWAWHPVAGGGVGADLPAITVQNGLEAERQALRRFATVLSASFNLPARYVEPGVVEVRSAPLTGVVTIGRFPSGASAVAEQAAADWGRSGYAVEATDDIQRWKAAKLLFNVHNAVDVFSGDAETVAELNEGLVTEARAALLAAGYSIAEKSEHTIDTSGFVVHDHPEGRAGGKSTWQSFARADASGHEVDFLNGEVVLLGRLHGVPTPLNEAVQRILGQSFASGEAPGAHDAREVLDAVAVPA
ncbi:2-dehydropantoate 2-reductase N-terminal domain-containing protein [Aeromicrobium panaciterrae]|uniref:ketopantoate reductase family protein n=1 Tax=Aeromicrobium panaciterrae TaxID=363861 RepID=UPI0031D48C0E